MRTISVLILSITTALSVGACSQLAPLSPVRMVGDSTSACQYRWTADKQPLPDPGCTPGVVNPAVTQGNISTTICNKTWLAAYEKQRPKNAATLKRKSAKAYGYTDILSKAEFDHLIPLELSGAANDTKNMWLEPPSPDWKQGNRFRNDKDDVENSLHRAVCSHRATLVQAQQAVVKDWTTALSSLGLGN